MTEASTAEPARRFHAALGLAAGTLLGGWLAATQFPASGNDDSHITFWSARALAEHGSILNYNGERIEQSSSLLLVLILAALHKVLSLPIPATAWALGILAAVATLAVVTELTFRIEPRAAPWAAPVLATSLPFAYWATSAMETSLTALFAYAFVEVAGARIDARARLLQAQSAGVVALMLGFVLVRPEAPVVLLCSLGGIAALHGWNARRSPDADAKARLIVTLELLAAGVVVVALVLGWRYASFGALVPNSAGAKVGGFEASAGAEYLWKGLGKGSRLLALGAVGGLAVTLREAFDGRGSSRSALLAALTVAYLAFVVMSGGDWMPCARLVVPLLPGLAVLTVVALARAQQLPSWAAPAVGVILVGLGLRAGLAFGSSKENGSYAGTAARAGEAALNGQDSSHFSFGELGNRAHRRDARLLGALLPLLERLAPSPAHPLYLMSGQAGMIPYYVFERYYGAAKFIDLFGITTRSVVPCLPGAKRRAGIHGIRLDPSYIIEHADEMPPECGARRPTVVFSTGRFPSYLADHGYEVAYQGPRELEAYVAVDREAK